MEKRNFDCNVPKIQCTYDYDKFTFFKSNRIIEQEHLNEVIESITKDGGWGLKYNPIKINEKKQIIDGQYRFTACKLLGYPIFFIIVPGGSMKEGIKWNKKNKSWNVKHYQNFYVKEGYSHYLKLEKFCSAYQISYGSGMTLLTGSKDQIGGRDYEVHANGNMKITSYEIGEEIMSYITSIEPYFVNAKKRSCIKAFQVCKYSNKYDHNRFMEKLTSSDSPKLEDCTTYKKYIKKIEEIYNHMETLENCVHFI